MIGERADIVVAGHGASSRGSALMFRKELQGAERVYLLAEEQQTAGAVHHGQRERTRRRGGRPTARCVGATCEASDGCGRGVLCERWPPRAHFSGHAIPISGAFSGSPSTTSAVDGSR